MNGKRAKRLRRTLGITNLESAYEIDHALDAIVRTDGQRSYRRVKRNIHGQGHMQTGQIKKSKKRHPGESWHDFKKRRQRMHQDRRARAKLAPEER